MLALHGVLQKILAFGGARSRSIEPQQPPPRTPFPGLLLIAMPFANDSLIPLRTVTTLLLLYTGIMSAGFFDVDLKKDVASALRQPSSVKRALVTLSPSSSQPSPALSSRKETSSASLLATSSPLPTRAIMQQPLREFQPLPSRTALLSGTQKGPPESLFTGSLAPQTPSTLTNCNLSIHGEWAYPDGSRPHRFDFNATAAKHNSLNWRPLVPCAWSVGNRDAFLFAFAGMTITLIGDSVTKHVFNSIAAEFGFDGEHTASISKCRVLLLPNNITMRYCWVSGADDLNKLCCRNIYPLSLPSGRRGIWLVNVGLWNLAYPVVSNTTYDWSHDNVTLESALARYTRDLSDAISCIKDSDIGRDAEASKGLYFRLTTPFFSKISWRDGWVTWALRAYKDLDDANDALNAVAARLWKGAGWPIIELTPFIYRDRVSWAPACCLTSNEVYPILTIDSVHVPPSISREMFWWMLSTVHADGLSSRRAS